MSPSKQSPTEDEPTEAPDAPQSDETSPDAPEVPEPFDHAKHAPTVAPGTEMPDLGERPPITEPRDDGLGHAGIEGSPGYPVEAPDIDKGKKAQE